MIIKKIIQLSWRLHVVKSLVVGIFVLSSRTFVLLDKIIVQLTILCTYMYMYSLYIWKRSCSVNTLVYLYFGQLRAHILLVLKYFNQVEIMCWNELLIKLHSSQNYCSFCSFQPTSKLKSTSSDIGPVTILFKMFVVNPHRPRGGAGGRGANIAPQL